MRQACEPDKTTREESEANGNVKVIGLGIVKTVFVAMGINKQSNTIFTKKHYRRQDFPGA